MTNIYLLEDDDGLTLVDAGLPAQMELLRAELERIGAEITDIKAVILTHIDPDHIGLAESLRERRGFRLEFSVIRSSIPSSTHGIAATHGTLRRSFGDSSGPVRLPRRRYLRSSGARRCPRTRRFSRLLVQSAIVRRTAAARGFRVRTSPALRRAVPVVLRLDAGREASDRLPRHRQPRRTILSRRLA